ncbi:MAG TPA: glycosyltransferase family 4 protein [Bryobacteraceae bacterium]|jgi:hypothetical protein|nr:glycosyltransferase family 4 protein [Bryobacteraceae bacterium]
MRHHSAVLSANATPQIGGQGTNLSQMADAIGDNLDTTVFCRDSIPGLRTTVVPESAIAKAIGETPFLRRWAGFQVQLSNAHFDRLVAAKLPQADIFQGTTGQCLESLKRAKAQGAFAVLDSITTHVDDFWAHQQVEYAFFGMAAELSRRSRYVANAEYQLADSIRVMSEHAKNTFVQRGIGENKVFVAKPPLAVAPFPVADFRSEQFRVSYIGLLTPTKGFHYLVQAFRNLPVPDAELVLWSAPGHRPVARYMREQMESDPRIRMNPISVRQNYKSVYGGSYVVVHPSLADGYAYVVMEAMASGLPVIVTSSTGSAQLIRDGENGYVVPARDPDAIRERLLYLAEHPAVLRRMGAAARQTIERETPQSFSEFYGRKLKSWMVEGAACKV